MANCFVYLPCKVAGKSRRQGRTGWRWVLVGGLPCLVNATHCSSRCSVQSGKRVNLLLVQFFLAYRSSR